jgi:hypothetical protein
MTRSTRVAVTSPGIDPMEMWRTLATLIQAPEQYRFAADADGIHAALNQGLCALLDLDFAVNLVEVPEGRCDEYCDPDCSGEFCWEPAHYLMADFDTAYSYTDPCGCHSGGLHIRLVAGLGDWLTQQGATWLWWDESGEGWNHGPDWGSLASHGGACPTHAAIQAPPALTRKAA